MRTQTLSGAVAAAVIAIAATAASGRPSNDWEFVQAEPRNCYISIDRPATNTSVHYFYDSGERKLSLSNRGLPTFPQKITFHFGASSFSHNSPVIIDAFSIPVDDALEAEFEKAASVRVTNEAGELLVSAELFGQRPFLQKLRRKCS